VTFDQRDVHGELAVALDELAGAVERIDQPVAWPAAAFAPRGDARFFGKHRQRRLDRGQSGEDDALRGEIGGGERRGVGLALDDEIAAIDVEDRLARLPRDGGHRMQQRTRRGVVAHGR